MEKEKQAREKNDAATAIDAASLMATGCISENGVIEWEEQDGWKYDHIP